MSPNFLDVIVINDSDPDDNLQPSASSVLLADSTAGIPSTANSNATNFGHPATPRGKSEPTLWATGLGPPAETQICQRQTRSLPHDVIDVDADEPSDGPPVSFQITAFVSNPYETNQQLFSQNGPEPIGLHHRCHVKRANSTSEHGTKASTITITTEIGARRPPYQRWSMVRLSSLNISCLQRLGGKTLFG